MSKTIGSFIIAVLVVSLIVSILGIFLSYSFVGFGRSDYADLKLDDYTNKTETDEISIMAENIVNQSGKVSAGLSGTDKEGGIISSVYTSIGFTKKSVSLMNKIIINAADNLNIGSYATILRNLLIAMVIIIFVLLILAFLRGISARDIFG